MIQLACFAKSVGHDDRARVWAEQGIELAERNKRTITIVDHEEILPQFLHDWYQKSLVGL